MRRLPLTPCRQRGTALIETPFLLLVLLLLTACVLQLGRAMWYYEVADKAARNAARYLSRVPQAEITAPGKGIAARNYAIAMVNQALLDAGMPPAVLVQAGCNPSPSCNSATPPQSAVVSVTLQVIDFWLADLYFGVAPEANPLVLRALVTVQYTGR